jgi:dihydroorotase
MTSPPGLLLTGGTVLDPGAGLSGAMDVRLRAGRVMAVAPGLAADGDRTIDVRGRLVVPGLIDLHAHCFIGASDLGPRTDAVCSSSGVTTLVDGGSAGAGLFEGLREFVASRARTRILAFVNISAVGLAYLDIGELNHLAYADPDRAAAVAREHRDIVVGIKVRNQAEVVGDAGVEPVRRAVRAAEASGGRVMVHVTNPPVALEAIVALLRPGDIVTHFLNGRGDGILDPRGQVKSAIRAARERGVLFDVGHGRNHVNFNVARAALGGGFAPDTISSDLTSAGRAGCVKDLPTTLSKFLNLGMSLEAVVRAATAAPAAAIGRAGELGTLAPGAAGDLAVFELEEGRFDFEDADRQHLSGTRRLQPVLTIRAGEVWWAR